MLKLKTPGALFFASSPKLPASKANLPPVNKTGQTNTSIYPPAKDHLLNVDSGATPNELKNHPDDAKPVYPAIGNSASVDPKFATFNSNVEALRKNLAAADATPKKKGNTQTRPIRHAIRL